MAKNKCTCSEKQPVTCKNCSVISMCIMLKNGQKHLKVWNANSQRNVNPVWHSPIKYNSQNPMLVVNKMIQAFNKSTKYTGATNCLMFYIKGSKNYFHKHSL